MTKQKLAETLTRALLIFSGVLAGAHQITKSFMRRGGNPHRRQITRPVAACEFFGVAAIGLDAVACFDRVRLGATT